MTVQELIEKLQSYPKDAEVWHWDEELYEKSEDGWAYMGEYSVFYDEQYNQVRIQ